MQSEPYCSSQTATVLCLIVFLDVSSYQTFFWNIKCRGLVNVAAVLCCRNCKMLQIHSIRLNTLFKRVIVEWSNSKIILEQISGTCLNYCWISVSNIRSLSCKSGIYFSRTFRNYIKIIRNHVRTKRTCFFQLTKWDLVCKDHLPWGYLCMHTVWYTNYLYIAL